MCNCKIGIPDPDEDKKNDDQYNPWQVCSVCNPATHDYNNNGRLSCGECAGCVCVAGCCAPCHAFEFSRRCCCCLRKKLGVVEPGAPAVSQMER